MTMVTNISSCPVGCDGVPCDCYNQPACAVVDECDVCGGNNDCLEAVIEGTVVIDVVWGIEGIDREGADYKNPLAEDVGDPIYDKSFKGEKESAQLAILDMCNALGNNSDLVVGEERCVMKAFRSWALGNYLPWPVPASNLSAALQTFVVGTRYIGDVAFTEIGEADAKVMWVRVAYKSKLSISTPSFEALEMAEEWDDFIAKMNKQAPDSANKAFQTSETWVQVFTEVTAVNGVIYGILVAAALTLLSVFLFTGSPILTGLTIAVLLEIVFCVMGFLWIVGWSLGGVEAISLSILLGVSVDYCMHLAEAYIETSSGEEKEVFEDKYGREMERYDVMREVLTKMGISIVGSASTTVLAILCVFFCYIQVFIKLGTIITVIMIFSVIFAVGPFSALCVLFGPKTVDRSPKRLAASAVAIVAFYSFVFLMVYAAAKAGANITSATGEPLFD